MPMKKSTIRFHAKNCFKKLYYFTPNLIHVHVLESKRVSICLNFSWHEEVVVEWIEEFVKEENFHELPTIEILKIIGKSKIENVELLCEVISRTTADKREESILFLNFIKREESVKNAS